MHACIHTYIHGYAVVGRYESSILSVEQTNYDRSIEQDFFPSDFPFLLRHKMIDAWYGTGSKQEREKGIRADDSQTIEAYSTILQLFIYKERSRSRSRSIYSELSISGRGPDK